MRHGNPRWADEFSQPLKSGWSLGIITQVTTAVTPTQSTNVRNMTLTERNCGIRVTLKNRTGGNTAVSVTTAVFHFGGGFGGGAGPGLAGSTEVGVKTLGARNGSTGMGARGRA